MSRTDHAKYAKRRSPTKAGARAWWHAQRKAVSTRLWVARTVAGEEDRLPDPRHRHAALWDVE